MSDEQEPDRADPPRLQPRGLDRPPVDAESAAVFGRPAGVEGAFGDRATSSNGHSPRSAAPPTAALAAAFGRPAE